MSRECPACDGGRETIGYCTTCGGTARVPSQEPAHDPRKIAGAIAPGTLLKLRGLDRDEANYKLGTLWVWTRNEEQHYLVQTSHRKHCHRVQAVFWTSVVANVVRKLIEEGMKSGDVRIYTMLREAGIAPMTQYRKPERPRK